MENVVTVFSRLFAASWGFRTDDLLRVACLTLRAGPETPSLAQIPNCSPTHTRSPAPPPTSAAAERAPGQVNAELARYWRWFASLSDPARAQVTAPLLNKLRALLLRPFARQLLCGDPPPSTSPASSTGVGCCWCGSRKASSARRPPAWSAP